MDRSRPGGPRGPQPPLVDQERSGPPWTTLRHFPDAIGRAFYQFHTEKADLIRTSFHKVGLALPIDGSSDHELDTKGFTDLEMGNWREDLSMLDDRADVTNEEDWELELVSMEPQALN